MGEAESQGSPARVLVVDHERIVREALCGALSRQGGYHVAGEAAESAGARERVVRDQPDLMLLEVGLPGGGAIDLIRSLTGEGQRTRILVLTSVPAAECALPSLRAGATGFLHKSCSSRELFQATEQVLCGERSIPKDVIQLAMANHSQPQGTVGVETLSRREREVFSGIGAGETVAEISRRLGLSPKTISTYRRRLLAKLRLTTTSQIIRHAIEQESVEPPWSAQLQHRDLSPRARQHPIASASNLDDEARAVGASVTEDAEPS